MSAPLPLLYSFRGAALMVGLIGAWRLMILAGADLNLSFDEAQYWVWSQSLEFGYFSKPPFVAWVIALTTGLFGEGETAIKLGALLANLGVSLTLYVLARRLYGEREGFWAAVVFATLPAVSLSSMVVSVDPFLLLFWGLALVCLHKALEEEDRLAWWVGLGLALGFGLLAKYAMGFFLLGFLVFTIWSPERIVLWRHKGTWLALGVAAAIIAPNVAWNAAHGFITFAHTKANANLGGSLFHPDKGLEFIGGQFAVFGPLLFATLAWLILRTRREVKGEREKFLLSFILPVLLPMVVQAFLSRANPNWAAPIYVAATVLVVGWLVAKGRWWVIRVSVILHLALAAAVYNIETLAPLAGVELTAKTDLLKRTRGWDQVAAGVEAFVRENPEAKLLFDARKVMAPLLYYIHPHPLDAAMWNQDVVPTNHFEMFMDIKDRVGESFLLITEEPNANHIAPWFESVEQLDRLRVTMYARPEDDLNIRIFRAVNFKGY